MPDIWLALTTELLIDGATGAVEERNGIFWI